MIRPGSSRRPVASSPNASRPSSAFLDNSARLSYGQHGPWAAVRPSTHGQAIAPLTGTMPSAGAKTPRWGSTLLWQKRKVVAMQAGEAPGNAADCHEDYNRRGHGKLHPSSRSNSEAMAQWTNRVLGRGDGTMDMHNESTSKVGPASGGLGSSISSTGARGMKLKTEVVSPVEVSSVPTYIAESRRRSLFLKDFISSRLKDDLDDNPEVGLNDLCLFHSLAARSKSENSIRRKRPPIAQDMVQQLRAPVSRQGSKDDDWTKPGPRQESREGCGGSATATATLPTLGRRRSLQSISAAAGQVHQLCSLLRQDSRDHARCMDGIRSESKRPLGGGRESMLHMTPEVVRRVVGAQFRQAAKKAWGKDAPEDVIYCFGSLMLFLLDRFGSLMFAMEHLDPKKKRRLKREQFEKGLQALGFQQQLSSKEQSMLGKIFSVLDQDQDSEIGYEDVACYQPRSDEARKVMRAISKAEDEEDPSHFLKSAMRSTNHGNPECCEKYGM